MGLATKMRVMKGKKAKRRFCKSTVQYIYKKHQKNLPGNKIYHSKSMKFQSFLDQNNVFL